MELQCSRIWPTHWKVCLQSPSAAQRLNTQYWATGKNKGVGWPNMNWYRVVHSRLPSHLFWRELSHFNLPHPKSLLFWKEKKRTKQKQTPQSCWHLRAMSSAVVSDTAGHTTFSRSFPTLPHFPICERDQKFLPLVSSSDAVRTSRYLHRFLNVTKARKRKNIIWRLTMPGFVLWWLPRVLSFMKTAKSSSSSSTSKAAQTVCVCKRAWFSAWIRDRRVYKVVRFAFFPSERISVPVLVHDEISALFHPSGLAEAQVQCALA